MFSLARKKRLIKNSQSTPKHVEQTDTNIFLIEQKNINDSSRR